MGGYEYTALHNEDTLPSSLLRPNYTKLDHGRAHTKCKARFRVTVGLM